MELRKYSVEGNRKIAQSRNPMDVGVRDAGTGARFLSRPVFGLEKRVPIFREFRCEFLILGDRVWTERSKTRNMAATDDHDLPHEERADAGHDDEVTRGPQGGILDSERTISPIGVRDGAAEPAIRLGFGHGCGSKGHWNGKPTCHAIPYVESLPAPPQLLGFVRIPVRGAETLVALRANAVGKE